MEKCVNNRRVTDLGASIVTMVTARADCRELLISAIAERVGSGCLRILIDSSANAPPIKLFCRSTSIMDHLRLLLIQIWSYHRNFQPIIPKFWTGKIISIEDVSLTTRSIKYIISNCSSTPSLFVRIITTL